MYTALVFDNTKKGCNNEELEYDNNMEELTKTFELNLILKQKDKFILENNEMMIAVKQSFIEVFIYNNRNQTYINFVREYFYKK